MGGRLTVLSLMCLPTWGCFTSGAPSETLEVVLPGGAKETAEAGTGPALLAGGTWAGFRKADPDEDPSEDPEPAPGPYGGLLNGGLLERPPVDEQIFLIDLDADGKATRVRENKYFLPDIYGATIPVDNEFRSASLFGVTFAARSFGVSVEDAFGIAIEARVRLFGIYVGRAIIYAWGTGDDRRVDGQFGYLLNFDGGLGDLLLDTGGDQYPFYAERVDGEGD
ncbi:MAG: hypothetical protein C4547_04645 [Phycisphaerales bacterium]|nr:MAG: hypothetical protein C4547_04645 [Phycisphaerales bacterium]